MFENILNFFKKFGKNENKETSGSKNKAKERLHLVLMQDRANVSADFLELMKQEIIEVIKKYIQVEESEIDVRLTNEIKDDGTTGAPSLYANIPIVNIRNDMKKEVQDEQKVTKQEKDENKDKSEKDSKQEQEEKKNKKENEEVDNEKTENIGEKEDINEEKISEKDNNKVTIKMDNNE